MPDELEASDALMGGAAPLVRKIVSSLVEQWPKLYPLATILSIVIAFLAVLFVKVMPEQWQLLIKSALALAGISSVYSDWRMTRSPSVEVSKAEEVNVSVPEEPKAL